MLTKSLDCHRRHALSARRIAKLVVNPTVIGNDMLINILRLGFLLGINALFSVTSQRMR
jgi:hypothetical protein